MNHNRFSMLRKTCVTTVLVLVLVLRRCMSELFCKASRAMNNMDSLSSIGWIAVVVLCVLLSSDQKRIVCILNLVYGRPSVECKFTVRTKLILRTSTYRTRTPYRCVAQLGPRELTAAFCYLLLRCVCLQLDRSSNTRLQVWTDRWLALVSTYSLYWYCWLSSRYK